MFLYQHELDQVRRREKRLGSGPQVGERRFGERAGALSSGDHPVARAASSTVVPWLKRVGVGVQSAYYFVMVLRARQGALLVY